ncbi:MAG: hypothetical protein ACLS70_16545 [[Clostridium] symbiosum]
MPYQNRGLPGCRPGGAGACVSGTAGACVGISAGACVGTSAGACVSTSAGACVGTSAGTWSRRWRCRGSLLRSSQVVTDYRHSGLNIFINFLCHTVGAD